MSGSLIDVSCLIHRLIHFSATLCQTLCCLPAVENLARVAEKDREMLQLLIEGRKDILDKVEQVTEHNVFQKARRKIKIKLSKERPVVPFDSANLRLLYLLSQKKVTQILTTLSSFFQTIWFIVTGYVSNILAFDLCGVVEGTARQLVSDKVSGF